MFLSRWWLEKTGNDRTSGIVLEENFLGPVRWATLLASLLPAYPLMVAVAIGVLVRLTLASAFGVVFVIFLALLRQLQASAGRLLVYGSGYGCALWVVNFLGVAALLFPRFTTVNQFWIGFVAHTFFYGTALGACVARACATIPMVATR